MELECSAGVSKLSIKAKETDGIVTRTVRITLVREFDPVIARAIGGDAPTLLDSLKGGGVAKVVIPIDGVVGELDLDGERGDTVTIKMVQGVKAVGSASTKEDEEPKVELVFDFPFVLKAWDFFGQNVGSRAALRFSQSQLELPGTGKPAAASNDNGGAKLQKVVDDLGERLGVHVAVTARDEHGRVLAHAETEEQAAETPDDAEALREERLARERAEAAAEVAPAAPSPFCLARMEAVTDEIVVTTAATGAFVARWETPISIMEAEGDDEEGARAALRVKLLAKFTDDEAKLAGGSAPPKVGLKSPARAPVAPDPEAAAVLEDEPFCEPGCVQAHVHNHRPGEEEIAF